MKLVSSLCSHVHLAVAVSPYALPAGLTDKQQPLDLKGISSNCLAHARCQAPLL